MRHEPIERWIAYVSRISYPDPAANALQTLHTATSFVTSGSQVELFVHDFPSDREEFLSRMGVPASDILIRSLHVSRWPKTLKPARYLAAIYNTLIAARLPTTTRPQVPRILFVRSRLEMMYWGLMRRRFPWLRNWLLACEIHGFPEAAPGVSNKARMERLLGALEGFDVVITVTDGLAEDLIRESRGRLQVEVLPLGSALPRAKKPDLVNRSTNGIRMGYVGTIDERRGVADLVRALAKLPESWTLTLVGRSANGYDRYIRRLATELKVVNRLEIAPSVPYSKVPSVASELDICLAPAGGSEHVRRYASPLKIFDYMALGKPIVTADVPAHREVLRDGETAQFYPQGDADGLATCLTALAAEPSRLATIAHGAWEASSHHNYAHRADAMCDLFDRSIELRRDR